ncbi:MAG: preprotein translocase subunit SecG [Candidatus Longimicrobiales bacterium M2_2A_002]
MFGILLTLLIIDGVLLMVIVLLQAGKGGGLAAMGGGSAGTESFMGGRQAATVLTKATWATGAIFLALAVVLSILSTRRQDATPLLQDEFQTAPTAPQPVLPGTGGGEATGEGEGTGIPGLSDQPQGDEGGGQEGGGPDGGGQ